MLTTLTLAALLLTLTPLDLAREQAHDAGQMLLIEGGAPWCLGCVRMERETWPDPDLAAWLADRVVVLHLNVDEDPGSVRSLGMAGFPAMVLERDGVELDRVSGFYSPDELRAWIESASTGVSQVQRLRARVAGAKSPREEASARSDLLIELIMTGRWIGVAAEGAELWTLIPEVTPPNAYLTRLRTEDLPRYLSQAAQREPEAARLIASLSPWPNRDAPPPDATLGAIDDWIVIDRATNAGDRAAAWAKRAVASGERLDAVRAQHRLFELFAEREDWPAAGAVLGDPDAWWRGVLAKRDHLASLKNPTPRDTHDLTTLSRTIPGDLGARVGALRAADRTEEADALERAARNEWPNTPEIDRAIREGATRAGVSAPGSP